VRGFYNFAQRYSIACRFGSWQLYAAVFICVHFFARISNTESFAPLLVFALQPLFRPCHSPPFLFLFPPSHSTFAGMKSKAKAVSQLRAAGPQPLAGRVSACVQLLLLPLCFSPVLLLLLLLLLHVSTCCAVHIFLSSAGLMRVAAGRCHRQISRSSRRRGARRRQGREEVCGRQGQSAPR
jgi:hypothetical protein